MTKRQANYYLRRIYRLLKSDKAPILLQRLKKNRGETDFATIWLDPREHLLPTIIHECLHILYPNLRNHKKQLNPMENQICKHMSICQYRHLLLRLALAVNNISLE